MSDSPLTQASPAPTAPLFRLDGCVAIVTGAGRGMGRGVAETQARHAFPAWWVERVRHSHPQAWQEVLAAGNTRPPMALRVNPRRATLPGVEGGLAGAGLEFHRLDNDALLLARPLAVARLPGHEEGRFSVQDAGAQWAARLLDAKDGERVLDACSAPGGKTAHILERAGAELLALELDPANRMPLAQSLAPAIAYARDGAPITQATH